MSWLRHVFLLLLNCVYRKRGQSQLVVPNGPVSVAEFAQSLAVVICVVQKQSFAGVASS